MGVGSLFGPYEINNYLDGMPYLPGIGMRGTYDIQECLSKLPSCKIYRFGVERRQFTVANSIAPLPTLFAPSFMGNISSDVNSLVYCRSDLPETVGLWVLSSSGKWQPLSPPSSPLCFAYQSLPLP